MADLDREAIYQLGSTFTPASRQPFIPCGKEIMPDNPEFIQWVDDARVM